MTDERPLAEWSTGDLANNALALTRWSIIGLDPASWDRLASVFRALLEREPMKSGDGWENERNILGCLVNDLELMAKEAGHPLRGSALDLRDPKVKAAEQQLLVIHEAMQLGRLEYVALVAQGAAELAAYDEAHPAPEPIPTW